MKKTVFSTLFIFLCSLYAFSQVDFGIKAGLNYNFSGDLTQTDEINTTTNDIKHGAENKIGYHGGLFVKFQPMNFLIKSELNYTQYKTEYANSTSLDVKQLNIPIHIGTKVFGPMYIFAGPDFMYTLDESFSSEDYKDIKYDDFTVGVNLGLGVEFGSFAIEAKWDKALTGDETYISKDNIVSKNFETDTRPNQLIFSVLIAF